MSVVEHAIALDAIPQVLRWEDEEATAVRVHDGWASLIRERLHAFVDELRDGDAAAAVRVAAALETLPEESLERLLLAPETTCRIFWRSRGDTPALARFLERAAGAEAVRIGLTETAEAGTWTALGDFCAAPRVQAPVIPEFPTLDLDSPAARIVDLTGERYTVETARAPLAGAARALVLERLAEVSKALPAAGDVVAWFVSRFTKVLILQRDDEQPFSSGSNGQFVGRSVVANPQLEGIDGAVIADAVVHEAIHALLYMQELRRPWVLDETLYDTTPRAVSPWSGRELPLRPFLQACFVWYGLLNFWARVDAAGVFEESVRRGLLLRAAAGFLGDPLRLQLQPYRGTLRDEVVVAIDAMQDDVADCFGGSP
jgi:hypothetical protein